MMCFAAKVARDSSTESGNISNCFRVFRIHFFSSMYESMYVYDTSDDNNDDTIPNVLYINRDTCRKILCGKLPTV